MSLRNYLFNLATADTVLNSLGLNASSTFTSNDKDTPQARPFMVFRWGATNPGMSTVNQRTLRVWVHDEPSDYTNIDIALKRLQMILLPLAAVPVGGAGEWVSQIEWTGDSDDLDDDIQNTITRWTEFQITGSAV
jgi:hypothetical protein